MGLGKNPLMSLRARVGKAFQKPMADGVKLLNAIQDVYLDKGIGLA